MKARALIGTATYEPRCLANLFQAFDRAWEAVSPQIDQRPQAIEAARLKLAEIVLREGNRFGMEDSAKLAEIAAQVMIATQNPRSRHGPPEPYGSAGVLDVCKKTSIK